VLITRGKDGMLLVDRNGHDTISATAQEVYDVTGAGDTVSAFLGFMIAAGNRISMPPGLPISPPALR